jgi:branched-chain amino acid transport system substrate-binding protein
MSRSLKFAAASLAGAVAMSFAAFAQAQTPGVTPTEIKIGQTFAYSGPAGAFSTIAKTDAAYFKYINDQGGINGHKINFISLDDGYAPPKGLELTRQLVEQEGVAIIYGSLGTAVNKATQKYLNQKKVPQVLIASPAPDFGDPKNYPWTMGWQSNTETEAAIFGKYILKNKPNAKIGVMYQNDDYGRGMLSGLKRGLGEKNAGMIVAAVSYETTDATIDSQITSLRAAGADTFVNASIPKFAAQAIRLAYDSGWKPMHFLGSVSNSIGLTLKPAGFDKSQGLISAQFYKDPTDPRWANDPALDSWRAWAKKYYPEADLTDANNVYAFARVNTMVQILKQCGNDFSRENIMKQAANLKDYEAPGLLPGIRLNTSPTDFHPVRQMQMLMFDGSRWQLSGDVIGD